MSSPAGWRGGFGPTARWVLLGLGAALVLLPLGLRRPGVPLGLRADEPSHYLLARSLAHDGDAVVGGEDLDRYFREFPYSQPIRLELGLDPTADDPTADDPTVDDDAAGPRFAVDPLYALALVPWVAVGRADAAWAFNALCFVLALALVGRHLLRSRGDPGAAWALVGGALFLSAAFVYVFWVHPASLHLVLVAIAFALGWSRSSRLPALVAGACLGLAVVEVPWLAALVPALLCRGRAVSKGLGLVAGGLAALGAAWLVLGHPTAGGFAEHAAFVATTPDAVPTSGVETTEPRGLLPPEGMANAARRLALAWVDARRGLLPLFPFVLVFALPLIDRLRGRRSDPGSVDVGDALLAAGVAAIVLSRPFATADGADLARFGDPVLVAAWPALLFLLPRIRVEGRRGTVAVLATGFVSALLLLPTILTPFLPPVPAGDAHHASRGGLLAHLPTGLEETAEAGGFEVLGLGGSDNLRLWLPSWTHERRRDTISFLGGISAEGWLEVDARAAEELHLQVRNLAPDNRVRIHVGDEVADRLFPGAEVPESTRIVLPLDEALRPARRRDGRAVQVARFRVETSTGEKPFWRTTVHSDHYTGLELSVLGTEAHLERDIFAVEWLGCGAPSAVAPGESLRALVRLRNASDATWHDDGAARVRLGHRWRNDTSSARSTARTELPRDLEPGDEARLWVDVTAPDEPGRWTLEIEPIYEWVAWFSDRTDEAVCAVAVEVR